MVECELQISSDETLNTLVTTAKFNFNCRPAMLSADAMESTGQLPMLLSLIHIYPHFFREVKVPVPKRSQFYRKRLHPLYS